MKRILIKGIALTVIFSTLVCATYSFGYRRGVDQALVLDQKGVSVMTFGALQKIRAGDTAAGTQVIEKLCFVAADEVYAQHSKTKFIATTFLGDFKNYRQTYRSNIADWSVTEQHLDHELAILK